MVLCFGFLRVLLDGLEKNQSLFGLELDISGNDVRPVLIAH